MPAPVIRVENLSKRYTLGARTGGARYDTFREALVRNLKRPFSRIRPSAVLRPPSSELGSLSSDLCPPTSGSPPSSDFLALDDVSFEVAHGEVVGIIGRNGAGKSTLLKILSRITEPTSGRIAIRGRLASLLEVGTGFHPELTGRENIFLNGVILGMTRAEVKKRFDEIVAFAETERFLDTPVKHYSSGMYVRLAFAVAAHLDPEILIVDEVLSVGDSQFQKKCLGKMRDVSTHDGRTIILVSHDMSAITALTNRCVLLEEGRAACVGPTPNTVERYFLTGASDKHSYVAATTARTHVSRVEVYTSEPAAVQAAGKAMKVNIELFHPEPINGASISFQIINQFQQPATHIWVFDSEIPYAREPGVTTLSCQIPKVRLNVGHYTLNVFFTEPPGGRVFDEPSAICPFEVVRLGEMVDWGWRPDVCVYHEEAQWTAHGGSH